MSTTTLNQLRHELRGLLRTLEDSRLSPSDFKEAKLRDALLALADASHALFDAHRRRLAELEQEAAAAERRAGAQTRVRSTLSDKERAARAAQAIRDMFERLNDREKARVRDLLGRAEV